MNNSTRFKAIHITFVMLMIINFTFKSLPTLDSVLPFYKPAFESHIP